MEEESHGRLACGKCGYDKDASHLKIEIVSGSGIILCGNCRISVHNEKRTEKRIAKIQAGQKSKMKVCSKCKEEKPKAEFNKNRCRRDGYSYWCKMCCQGKAPGSQKPWVNPFPKDHFKKMVERMNTEQAEVDSWKERNPNEPH